jgi:hypothetical protein
MSNVSNPRLWENIKNKVMQMDTAGTRSGQWSGRKAQMSVRLYKEQGGGYIGRKDPHNSLTEWSAQQWTTKSGLPSHISGERYLPKKAIENLSSAEYKQTSKAKMNAMEHGEQFSKQPKKIAEKVKKYR